MGLLDFNDPQQAGMLALATGLLDAGAPSRVPVSLGQAFGRGLNGMQQAQMQAELMQRKKQEQEMQMQMQQMQMQQAQKQIADQKAMEQALMDRFRARQQPSQLPQVEQQQAPSSVQGYSMPTAQSQNDRVSGNYQAPPVPQMQAPQAPQMQQGFASRGDLVKSQIASLMQDAQTYAQMGTPQAQMMAQQAQQQAIALSKELPKYANEYRVGRDKNGNLVNVRLGDDGSEQYSPTQVAEKLHFADNGQQILGVDQYTGKPMVVSGKYQTPDSVASIFAQMRGQNMTDARQRDLNEITRQGNQTQVVNDPNQGILLVDKGTGLTRKTFDSAGTPIPSEAQAKKTSAANNILPILDQAEKLIGSATNSYVGAGVDALGRGFGLAPDGAKSIAQLKILEGNLMMNQPRMEGPQSDKDVALYRQMAAQLGDPTVPSEIKQAALQQIRAIHQKYATPTQTAPQGKQIVRTGVYGGRKVVQYSDGSVEYGN